PTSISSCIGPHVAHLLPQPFPTRRSSDLVHESSIKGERKTLVADSFIPAMMAAIYLIILLYFKAIGGYKPVHIVPVEEQARQEEDRKSTRLNSSHDQTSYAVFCLKKKNRT